MKRDYLAGIEFVSKIYEEYPDKRTETMKLNKAISEVYDLIDIIDDDISVLVCFKEV